MSFKNLATNDKIKDAVDSVGSSGPVDSNAYACTISMAYATKSSGGAMGLVLHLKADPFAGAPTGREIRETIYVTSGDKKGNLNYYENKDGEKNYLPGFILGNDLCLLTVGKDLSEIDTEDKIVNVYNFETKSEVPTKVPVLTELLDKRIIVGVLKTLENKQKKDDNGVYQNTGETREGNSMDKFFRERDSMTVAEIKGQAESPVFINTWKAKWAGEVRDRTSATNGTSNVAAFGAKPSAGAAAAPKKSLFN